MPSGEGLGLVRLRERPCPRWKLWAEGGGEDVYGCCDAKPSAGAAGTGTETETGRDVGENGSSRNAVPTPGVGVGVGSPLEPGEGDPKSVLIASTEVGDVT